GVRPAIPAAEDGGAVAPRRERVRRERARPLREEKPAREPARRPTAVAEPLSPEAQAVVRRRRLVGGGILLGVVALIVILSVAPLPANYQRYKFIQVTRQKIAPNTTYGGTPVLQGALANLVTPQQAQQQQQQQGGGTGTTPTPTTPTPTTPTP